MPAGPGAMGFVYFGAAKAVGYTAASVVLKNGYGLRESPKPGIWAVGLTRTLIGIGVGAVYGGLWYFVFSKFIGEDSVPTYYYLFLLPVRLAEWSLLLWLFFDRGLHDRSRMWKYVVFGTICSYMLDAIGVFAAFVLPGGMWIC